MNEWVVLVLFAIAGAWLLPALEQPAAYHDFADNRTLLGIANAGDVLSNAAFALAGLSVSSSFGAVAGCSGRQCARACTSSSRAWS